MGAALPEMFAVWKTNCSQLTARMAGYPIVIETSDSLRRFYRVEGYASPRRRQGLFTGNRHGR